MSMLPGFEAGTGGAVELQAAASSNAKLQATRFMIHPPGWQNYYRSLAEVKNKRANEKASREGGLIVVVDQRPRFFARMLRRLPFGLPPPPP